MAKIQKEMFLHMKNDTILHIDSYTGISVISRVEYYPTSKVTFVIRYHNGEEYIAPNLASACQIFNSIMDEIQDNQSTDMMGLHHGNNI